MGHQIIKQPDNLYCVFSSVVDDFIIIDADKEEILDYYKGEYGRKGAERVEEVFQKLEKGEKPYFQFTMDFKRAVELRDTIHGTDLSEEEKDYQEWYCRQKENLTKTQ